MPRKTKPKNTSKNLPNNTNFPQIIKSKLTRLLSNLKHKHSTQTLVITGVSLFILKWVITPVPVAYFDLKWPENNKNLLKLSIHPGPQDANQEQHNYRTVTTNPSRVLTDTFLRSKVLLVSGGESTSLEHLVQNGWLHELSKRGFDAKLLEIPVMSAENYEDYVPKVLRDAEFMNIDSGIYNVVMFDNAIPKTIPFIISSPSFFASLTFVGFPDDIMDQVYSTVSNLKKLKHNDRVNIPTLIVPRTGEFPDGEQALSEFLHKPLIKCNQKNCNTFNLDKNTPEINSTVDTRNAIIDSIDLFFSQHTVAKARNPMGGTTIINKNDFVTTHFLQGNGTGKSMDADEFRQSLEQEIKAGRGTSTEERSSYENSATLERHKKLENGHDRWMKKIREDHRLDEKEANRTMLADVDHASSLAAKNFG